MLLNNHNLSIAAHCTGKPVAGYASNLLHLTEDGTLVANGPYSIFVSALDTGAIGCITVETAKSLGAEDKALVGPQHLTPLIGKMPPDNNYLSEKPVLFEMIIDAERLAQMAQLVVQFGGKALRIRFTGELDPVRIDSRNMETGQRWEGLLMPRVPGIDLERFEANDFDRALLAAARL